MELLFLGTGAGVPAKQRNVSSLALELLQERGAVWLLIAEKQRSIKFYIQPLNRDELRKFLLRTFTVIIFMAYLDSLEAVRFKAENRCLLYTGQKELKNLLKSRLL